MWAQEKIFPDYSGDCFTYFDTQSGYGYLWLCNIVFGANGSMNKESNKRKGNICSP